MSDLHLEFHDDGGLAWIEELTVPDVLILAGDITSSALLEDTLVAIAKQVQPSIVFHVCGNHEFYGGTIERTRAACWEASARASNLACLDRSVETVHDVRFVGAPLWYAPSPAALASAWAWSDFNSIDNLRPHWDSLHRGDCEFFDREMTEGDVCISHFIPSPLGIAPRWRNSQTNVFFLSDVSRLISARQPSHWVFGHTHDSIDQFCGPTRLICNPKGYTHEPNRRFALDFEFTR